MSTSLNQKGRVFAGQCPGWRSEARDGVRLFQKGSFGPIEPVLKWLEHYSAAEDFDQLTTLLLNAQSHFAFIIESSEYILACVDTIRSTPLFYTDTRTEYDECLVSSSARELLKNLDDKTWDKEGLTFLNLAGYVTGDKTVRKNIKQILPGSLILVERKTGKCTSQRYYRYLPQEIEEPQDESVLIDRLGGIMDRVFKRLIDRAQGRPIAIPLSGGFDSRIILCKLHELGYENLSAISYGAEGNAQAARAKIISAELGVPWTFIPSSPELARKHFESARRREYWDYADNLCTLPSMQEYEAFVELGEYGALPKDTIIINGQTGDFLTGGHIPKPIMDKGFGLPELIEYTIQKHFGVFPDAINQETKAYLTSYLNQQFSEMCKSEEPDRFELAACFESLEWQERQSKYVVNGQRIYDFLGYGWELPLWDLELMQFLEQVPLEMRYKQRLFKAYLAKYDYHGLFSREYPAQASYTSLMGYLSAKVSSVMNRLKVDNRSLVAWNYYYHGHYRTYYRMFDYGFFKKNIPIYGQSVPPAARWVVALLLNAWFNENDAPKNF